MPELYRLDVLAQDDDFALAEALVSQHATAGWEEESLPTGEIRLRVHVEQKAVLDALADDIRALLPNVELSFGVVPDQDWMEAWRDFFTPVETGDYLVLPPWLADTPSGGRLPIFIEPKSAFGTGHHPTTTLCLDAISRLHAAGALVGGQTFLDLGTGTGILGIGCVLRGLTGLGLDIDPLAVSNAEENKVLNHISDAFAVRSGSVDTVAGQTFDVVIANILAAPLVDMAADIMAAVKPGGSLILSGFLKVQTPNLERAYAQLGMPQRLSEPSIVKPLEPGKAPEEWECLFWRGIK